MKSCLESIFLEKPSSCIKREILTRQCVGSFASVFNRNAINNGLLTIEVPRLVRRLREVFSSTAVDSQQNDILEPSKNRESLDSPPPAPQSSPKKEKILSRRTGWYVISKSLIIEAEMRPDCLPKKNKKTHFLPGHLLGTLLDPSLQ